MVLLVVSDILFPRIVTDPLLLRELQGVKGAVEIALSAGLIYFLVSRSRRQLKLKDRAIDEASVGIVISDPEQPDNPLVYVNKKFEQMTGYSEADITGQNCRILQGENTDPETVATMAEAIEDDRPVTVEVKNYRKDGTEFWNEVSITPITDEEGAISNYLGFQRDITDRKERQQELSEFKTVVDTVPDGIYAFDADYHFERVNDGMAELTGYRKEDLVGSHASLIFDEETLEAAQRKRDNLQSGERDEERLETEIQTANGDTVPCEIRGCRLPGNDVSGVRTGGVIRDISDRKERVQEIEEARARLEVLFENSPDMVNVIDPGGTIVRTNQKFCEELRYEEEELIGIDIWEIDHQLTKEEVRSLADSLSQGESKRFETRYERKDGADFPVEVHLVKLTLGESERIVTLSRDITRQKERQQELEEIKEELEAIIDAAPVPITTVSRDGTLELWNDAAEEVFGWSADEVVGGEVPTVPQERADEHEKLRQDVFDGQVVRDFETVRLTKGGQKRRVNLSTAPIRDSDGTVTGAVGIYEDITERIRRQRELKESEQRYRTLTETAPDPVVVHRKGEILYANRAAAGLFEGTDSATLTGDDLLSYFPNADQDSLKDRFKTVQNDEQDLTGFEQRVQSARGGTRFVEIRSQSIQFDNERAVLSVLTDVTERKAHENALRRLQETTLELLMAESETEILNVAARASEEISNVTTAPFRFDEETSRLEPIAKSPVLEELDIEISTVSPDDGKIWDAFASNETVQIDGDENSVNSELLEAGEQALIAPLGNHGVLVGTIQPEEEFTRRKRELMELLATNLEAALDISADANEIREKKERLAEQNTRMQKLNRLNFVFREINKSLIQSDTPAEILEGLCERLAEVESYQFVWVSRLEGTDNDVEPVASCDVDPGYFDEIASTNHPLIDLIQRARSEQKAQLIQNILETSEWDAHREEALRYGYSSILAVPIIESQGVDRIFIIHGAEGETFSDDEIGIQQELGELIGDTIQRMESQSDAKDGAKTEIELEIEGQQLVFNRLSSELDTRVEIDGPVPADEAKKSVFLRIEGASSESVTQLVDDLHAVSEYEVISDEDELLLVGATVDTPAAIEIVEAVNGTVQSLVSDGETTTFGFEIPKSVNVRSIFDSISDEYESVELTARRDSTESVVPDLMDTGIENRLTEKQYEALQTALYGGLYDWPRKSSAEELAETLDVAPSTFQYHIRKGEKKVMEAVIG